MSAKRYILAFTVPDSGEIVLSEALTYTEAFDELADMVTLALEATAVLRGRLAAVDAALHISEVVEDLPRQISEGLPPEGVVLTMPVGVDVTIREALAVPDYTPEVAS